MNLDLFGRPSTFDTGARNDFDFYPTPSWMTRSLLHWHPAIKGATVLEPACGDHAIVDVLRAAQCQVYTNDFDPRQVADTHADATSADYWASAPPAEWVVSNFPFNIGFEILQHAQRHAARGVALLFRKTFLEPTEDRGPWLFEHPPTRMIGMPRHSFRGDGNDSVSCDWMIWERDRRRHWPPIVIDVEAKQR